MVDESFTSSSAIASGAIIGFFDPYEFMIKRPGRGYGRRATQGTPGLQKKANARASTVTFNLESDRASFNRASEASAV